MDLMHRSLWQAACQALLEHGVDDPDLRLIIGDLTGDSSLVASSLASGADRHVTPWAILERHRTTLQEPVVRAALGNAVLPLILASAGSNGSQPWPLSSPEGQFEPSPTELGPELLRLGTELAKLKAERDTYRTAFYALTRKPFSLCPDECQPSNPGDMTLPQLIEELGREQGR